MLCVALLQIAQTTDQLFAWNVFVVGKEIALGGLSSVVDENVGVGGHASDGTDHVAGIISKTEQRAEGKSVLIENVQLLSGGVLLQQLTCDLSLGGQDDAICC